MTPILLPQELETRSLGKSVFLRRERGVWDQLQRQKGLLASANELLSAQSAEVEDLRLRCADAKVEAAIAQMQLAPLAAWVKELEEELTLRSATGTPSGAKPLKLRPRSRLMRGSWGRNRGRTS